MPIKFTLESFGEGYHHIHYKTKTEDTELIVGGTDADKIVATLNKLVEANLDMGHQECVINKYIVKAIRGD